MCNYYFYVKDMVINSASNDSAPKPQASCLAIKKLDNPDYLPEDFDLSKYKDKYCHPDDGELGPHEYENCPVYKMLTASENQSV